MKRYATISAYIAGADASVRGRLREMRRLVQKLAPGGEEAMRYGMPTIRIGGKNLLHFAAMKGHLGFYPTPSGVAEFEDELRKRGVDFSKGCTRFPYDKPLPTPLIAKIIRFRLREESEKTKYAVRNGRMKLKIHGRISTDI